MPALPRMTIRLDRLRLSVELGCTPQERLRRQDVLVSVQLRLPERCPAWESDRLEDTLCYGRLAEAVTRHCESRPFQLIEKMAGDVYRICRELGGPEIRARVTVEKLRPPIPNLDGVAACELGDDFA